MQPTIDDLVEALKDKYPWIVRDTELVALGEQLRQEQIQRLRIKPGDNVDNITDVKSLGEKLELFKEAQELTHMLRGMVEDIIPEQHAEQLDEPGAAIKRHQQRTKENSKE